MSVMELHCLVAGARVTGSELLTVRNPYHRNVVGTVVMAGAADVESAIVAARNSGTPPSRFERSVVLEKARIGLEERREEFAHTITAETGLCLRESRYEVGRTLDVLRFSAMEALRDDGQIFSCDISAQGKARKIFTMREPLNCAVAITPFNHLRPCFTMPVYQRGC